MADKKPSIMQLVKKNKIWKSIFRHDFADTPRTRLQRVFGNVFLHLHPVRVAKDALKITYTWGLGGISFYLFLVLLAPRDDREGLGALIGDADVEARFAGHRQGEALTRRRRRQVPHEL